MHIYAFPSFEPFITLIFMWWVKTFLYGMGIGTGLISFYVSEYVAVTKILIATTAHSDIYVFQVSPKFTFEQQQKLAQAFQSWEKVRPVHIQFAEGDCPTSFDKVDACFIPTFSVEECLPDTKAAVGCTHATTNYIEVHIDVSCGNINTFYRLALHETGHVLGVGHSEDRSSVMYHEVTCK
jgi:hypothetical protein